MKFFVATFALLAIVTGANACGADCQVGVATGMSNFLFAQFADNLSTIYTQIQTALASNTAAAPALANIKTALTTAATGAQTKFYPAIHSAVFGYYHGVCTDVGLVCGNPVAVYYGAPNALTLAQNAAQGIVTPVVTALPQTLNSAVTSANLAAADATAVTAAIKAAVPTNITLKYDPKWIPTIQGGIVQWP